MISLGLGARAFILNRNSPHRLFKEILKLEFAKRELIEEYRNGKLIDLLLHAHRNTRYYREVLEECGVVKGNEVDLDRFGDIPVLTKDIITGRRDDLLSEDNGRRKTYRNSSGGSTGEPVIFIQDAFYKDWNWATNFFYNHMLGKSPGEKEIKLWGSKRDVDDSGKGIGNKIANFAYNRVLLDSFFMNSEKMRSHLNTIRNSRARSMWTYYDSALELASYIENENLEPPNVPITISTIGALIEEVCGKIEKNLGTKAYNQYGSREVGPIACECVEKKGLHVFEWTTYLEILKENNEQCGPGEEGELFVTLLTNYSMPLIRYRIGDTAVWSSDTACSCGRNLKKLEGVTGRITDHFRKKDGSMVHAQYFILGFYYHEWIKRFQVVQEDYDLVVCNIQVHRSPTELEKQAITDNIQGAMGRDCRVEFRFVDEIHPSPSGKYLYTISKVAVEEGQPLLKN